MLDRFCTYFPFVHQCHIVDQVNRLTASEIIEVFEPLEEGLDVIESKRYVSCMTIQLSINNEGIDENNIGYQPPLTNVELQDYESTTT
jgi:ribonuclease P/MRP protein subunit RPP25